MTDTALPEEPETRRKPLSLRKNFLWVSAGTVAMAAAQWGMLIVLARLGNAEMVGQFSLGMAVAAPIIALSSLQLRALQATDAARQFAFADYLVLRVVTTVAALLVIGALCMFGKFSPLTASVIFIVGMAKATDTLGDVVYGLLQQHQRMDRIGRLQIIKAVLTVPAVAGALYVTQSLVWALLALLATRLVRLACETVPSITWLTGESMRTVLQQRGPASHLARLAYMALPVGIATALMQLEASVPRFVLATTFSERDLGIYATMAYFGTMGRVVTQAAGQAAIPRLAIYYHQQKLRQMRRLILMLSGGFLAIGAALVVGALLVGKWFLEVIYGAEFATHSDAFAWIMVVTMLGFLYDILHQAVRAMRLFRAQLVAQLAGLIVLFAVVVPLVSAAGLVGAAYALIACKIVKLIICGIILARNTRTSGEPAGL